MLELNITSVEAHRPRAATAGTGHSITVVSFLFHMDVT
jgi:hypothetical protein